MGTKPDDLAPPTREGLIAWIDSVSNQHGINDAELCNRLNRQRARSSSGEYITIDAPTFNTLRAGGSLGDSRMRHIAEALEREFGDKGRPIMPAQSPSKADRLRELPLGRMAGVMASLVLLGAYLNASEAIKRKFEGAATVISILPIVLTCFLMLDFVRKRD